jgi:vacuolar-type H+-ATPase subunit I/STV1
MFGERKALEEWIRRRDRDRLPTGQRLREVKTNKVRLTPQRKPANSLKAFHQIKPQVEEESDHKALLEEKKMKVNSVPGSTTRPTSTHGPSSMPPVFPWVFQRLWDLEKARLARELQELRDLEKAWLDEKEEKDRQQFEQGLERFPLKEEEEEEEWKQKEVDHIAEEKESQRRHQEEERARVEAEQQQRRREEETRIAERERDLQRIFEESEEWIRRQDRDRLAAGQRLHEVKINKVRLTPQ